RGYGTWLAGDLNVIINPGSLLSERRGPNSGGGGGGSQGPFDLTSSTAIFGFSGRPLAAAKAGNTLFTVRRASDDSTLDVSDVSALAGFLASTTGFVTSWKDQGPKRSMSHK